MSTKKLGKRGTIMKKANPWILSLLSLSLVGIAPNKASAQEIEEPADDFSLTVFHANDMHAQIDDFGKISHFLNTERANIEHSLHLNAGDIFSGDPVVDLMDGIPMIELLNDLNLDLLTIGNHEFDYGQEIFQDRRNESNFNWLAANMVIDDPNVPIEDMAPYEIFTFDDVTVGVLGITEAPPATAPSGIAGMTFNPYILTAQQYSNLRDEVDILIGLTHIGIADDRRLAEAVDFFDVIIGGHSHTTIATPEIVNGTPIASTGSNANNIGILDITLDKDSGEVTVNGKLQPVSDLTEVNQTVQDKIDGYKADTDELLNVVIGSTAQELNRDARREMDASIGNLITDALRNFADTDIAITNNGGIRASIAAGDITARDIFTVDPFGNVVSIVEMTGHDLKEIIAYSYHRALEQYGPQVDLQTSGLHYTIYTKPDGTYFDSDLFINGAPMDLDATYTIATNNFMVEGGDGYDFSKARIIQEDQGQVTNALIQYISEVTARDGAVDYEPTEGRIQTVALAWNEILPAMLTTDNIELNLNEVAGELPAPNSLIANLTDLPEGTVVTFENAADIDLTGATTTPQVLEVLVTYPDDSTAILELTVTVVAVVESTPVVPVVPVVPEAPVVPEIPEEDELEVEVPGEVAEEEETTTTTNPVTGEKETVEVVSADLPATGETNHAQTVGMVVLLAGSSLLFIAKNKKKEEVN